jgi:glycosyltransferase involved in cell wall biosynthesis
MKLGTPVIATSIPSTREQVQDGVTGFLYEAGDVAALSRTIAQLDDDRASLAAVGASSRRWAETNFSLERYGNELGRVLTEAVQDRRSRSSPRQRLLR